MNGTPWNLCFAENEERDSGVGRCELVHRCSPYGGMGGGREGEEKGIKVNNFCDLTFGRRPA